MKQEIISELSTIKTLLWVNIALVSTCALYVLSKTFISNLSKIDSLKKEQFLSEAEALEDQGNYSQLESLAKERLKKYSRDSLTWWFLAIAQYKSNNFSSALNSFSELQSIDPTFQKETIEGYINEIRSSMQGPKGSSA